jgi:ABC-type transport system involved in cytochrome c biogenesis permease subunit
MKTFSRLIAVTLLLLSRALGADAPATVSLDLLKDKEVIALFSTLPVQEMGRVKPLDTIARFKLLRFSGKQSGISATRVDEATGKTEPILDPSTSKPLVDAKGKALKFTAMEWLLVSWFRPDIAKELKVFVVDNSEAVIELGLTGKGKRDRYTYNEIAPGRELLMQKMNELRGVEAKQRTPVQRALGKLSLDFLDYEMILSHFDFARAPFGKDASSLPPELSAHLKDGKTDWAGLLPSMVDYLKKNPEAAAPVNNPWMRGFYVSFMGALMGGNEETLPRFFPPPVGKSEVWHNPGIIIKSALEGGSVTPEDTASLNAYGSLATSAKDPALFKTQLKTLHANITKLASERNESGHVPMEVHYHKFDYFYKALLCFVTGLLLLGLSWVSPLSKWGRVCKKACIALTVGGAIFGTVGIVIRCLIMERPPITSLYETIIFITTTGVVLALLAEWMMKKGWALAVASVAGTAGMFLSIRFMNMEGRDTMELLQAVLITNFWLATHVPCINLGYAAGMVSAIFSVLYVILRVFGKVKLGDATAKDLTRMCYAFVIVGLFLSLVGTVLGGIWANYSWGRFWGWDPKENGALMIVLVNLVILHARLGGYIREVGFHVCGLLLGMVVAFSWFATNQLGVGLHAYGAMEGAWLWLYLFWGFLALLMVVAGFISLRDKGKGSAKPDPLPDAAKAAV